MTDAAGARPLIGRVVRPQGNRGEVVVAFVKSELPVRVVEADCTMIAPRQSRARTDASDGVRVQGRSTAMLTGRRSAAPQIRDPAAGMIGSRRLNSRPKMAAPP